MTKVNAMEMRAVEGGMYGNYYYVNGYCRVAVVCDDCGRLKVFKSKIWFGYKAGAKYQVTKTANNWLYNHGCWN